MNQILKLLGALQKEPELEPTRHPLSEEAQKCYWAVKASNERLREIAEQCMKTAQENTKRFYLTLEEMHPETLGRNISLNEGGNVFRFVKEDGEGSSVAPRGEPPEWVKELLNGEIVGGDSVAEQPAPLGPPLTDGGPGDLRVDNSRAAS